MSEPGNPFLSPLAQSATQLHELMESLIDAGFERMEALQIVIALTLSAVGQQ